MLIKDCSGNWLEPSIKTSPEDAFIRSEVTYEANGKEKQFHLVYVGFFEEAIMEASPFENDPIFTIAGKEINLRDITALIALIQYPEYRQHKRVYIHDQEQFNHLFTNINFEAIKHSMETLQAQGHFQLDASIPFLNETPVR